MPHLSSSLKIVVSPVRSVAMETWDDESSAVVMAPLVLELGLYVSSEAQGGPKRHAIFDGAAASDHVKALGQSPRGA
jgi:hypothetical protein